MVSLSVAKNIARGVPGAECDTLSPENTMPYWKLFYHLVWATRYRERVIAPAIETVIHDLLRTKAASLGATVFALNGMEDHIHLVVSVPPKLALADFIGKVKG